MKPLFEVGEEVILQSKDLPHLNDEYFVLGVYQPDELVSETEDSAYLATDLAYWLVHMKESPCGNEIKRTFSQTALRKKYEPGLDFDVLMARVFGDSYEAT